MGGYGEVCTPLGTYKHMGVYKHMGHTNVGHPDTPQV